MLSREKDSHTSFPIAGFQLPARDATASSSSSTWLQVAEESDVLPFINDSCFSGGQVAVRCQCRLGPAATHWVCCLLRRSEHRSVWVLGLHPTARGDGRGWTTACQVCRKQLHGIADDNNITTWTSFRIA